MTAAAETRAESASAGLRWRRMHDHLALPIELSARSKMSGVDDTELHCAVWLDKDAHKFRWFARVWVGTIQCVEEKGTCRLRSSARRAARTALYKLILRVIESGRDLCRQEEWEAWNK